MRERERASASFSQQASCTVTHTASHDKLHQRGREEGGTAQRALALPWTDTHTYIHTGAHAHARTHYYTGSQSAFHCTLLAARTLLCLVKKKQQTNRLANKRTKEETTHTSEPTGDNKKRKQKRNLGYKKSQRRRVLQKAFSQ